MEYLFYAEQIYLPKEGIVQARVLTAQEAEALGYEDSYTAQKPDGKLYVDGFEARLRQIPSGEPDRLQDHELREE